MIPLPLQPKIIKKNTNQSIFEIDGFYPGYGVTIGNSLRRVLLSSIPGVAVTEVRIKGASHEFSTVSGVLEDVMVIILNLKKLRFKIHEGETQLVQLSVKGEKVVTGADFKITPQIELANPEVHIATTTDKKSELEIEIKIEKGIGYEPRDRRKVKKAEIGTIYLDAIYTPIKNVNFNIESTRVGDRTDFDKLNLEIETDGTITPEDAFFDSCELLLNHFELILSGKEGKKEKVKKEESDSDNSEYTEVTKTKEKAKKSKSKN